VSILHCLPFPIENLPTSLAVLLCLPACLPACRVVANDAASYQYLVESIRMFPDQETWAGVSASASECCTEGRQAFFQYLEADGRLLSHPRRPHRPQSMFATRQPPACLPAIPPSTPRPQLPLVAAATLLLLLPQMLEDAGFRGVSYENLTMGVVAIHDGFKMA
jgi:hypothetical protein